MNSNKPLPKTPKQSDSKHGMSTVTPSPTTQQKACACNWNECKALSKAFNKMEHPYFKGEIVSVRLNDANGALNFIECACANLGISGSEKDQLLGNSKDNTASTQRTRTTHTPSGRKKDNGRLKIARHHFPVGMWRLKEDYERQNRTWSWVTGMSEEEVLKYSILPGNFKKDKVVRYDPNKSKKGRNGKERTTVITEKTTYIKAPCAAKRDVIDMANNKSRPNNIGAKRVEARSTQEWNAITNSNAEEIDSLRKRIRELEDRNETLEDDAATMKQELAKQKLSTKETIKYASKASKKMKLDHDKELAETEVQIQEAAVWEAAKDIILASGGLSRLTLFSTSYHDKNKDAAKILFGYNSWAETKEYVRLHFPGEVEEDFDSDDLWTKTTKKKTSSQELRLPNLSNFEKALICKMFMHRISDQKMVALIVARHQTTIGRILYEWGPKWGEVGEDLSNLDINNAYLQAELPDKLKENGYPKAVMIDGKDVTIGTKPFCRDLIPLANSHCFRHNVGWTSGGACSKSSSPNNGSGIIACDSLSLLE